jgi:hypothetical protein
MAHYAGDNVYVEFNGTDISLDRRTIEWNETGDLAEVSAGADADRTFVPTLKSGSASGEFVADSDGTAATDIWNLCVPLTEGTLVVGPEGTAAGKRKGSVNAFVTNRSEPHQYDAESTLAVEWTFSGAVTWGVFP